MIPIPDMIKPYLFLSIIQKTAASRMVNTSNERWGKSGGLFGTISKSYLIKAEKISAGFNH